MRIQQFLTTICGMFLLLVSGVFVTVAAESNHYMDMSLEELLNVEVSSVSRRQELLRHAGAAVFVISAEDIRRAGITSIPEALRMVPGMNVARINSNEWAVSARGFNGRFANKLLVQIDGRSVYAASFSGVYWDVLDTMLEDIDRIEVIRGPGATLWGSNAVNGIINIITKQAVDTQGGLIAGGGGSLDQGTGALRYGGALGESGYGRGYLKYDKRGQLTDTLNGNRAGDSWDTLRGGMRLDLEPSASDTLSLQVESYQNHVNQYIGRIWQATPPYAAPRADAFTASGWHAQGEWGHHFSDTNSALLKTYYDHSKRNESYVGQQHDTIDIDFQHQFQPINDHQIVWGMGYRHTRLQIRNSFETGVLPINPNNNLLSTFIQDDIALADDAIHLVLGSKFERNDFTGWEVQPNARLTWAINDKQTLWAAVSRASRTPSQVELYGTAVTKVVPPALPFPPVPLFVMLNGNAHMQAETLTAYELGYRLQPIPSLNLDLAGFYNVYNHLRTFELVAPTTLMIDNRMKGHTYGVELAADWQAREWWQWRLAYSYLNVMLQMLQGRTDLKSVQNGEGSSPKHQISLRSSMSFPGGIELDVWGRYNSVLAYSSPDPVVPSMQSVAAYTELDIRLGWHPRKDIELSLSGKNLLHAKHLEFIQESFMRPTSVERSVYGKVTLQF